MRRFNGTAGVLAGMLFMFYLAMPPCPGSLLPPGLSTATL